MTYPFVQAKWYSPNAIIEVRALVLHFAEGGGTVSYLRDPRHPDGTPIDVSAHFVIEDTGRIVQMVRDHDADHCQHVSPGSWSYPGDLTRANGVAVLGSEVMDNPDHTRVNRYVQAVEIVGYRDKGMNAAQAGSLRSLVAERRAKFPTIRGLLGHGDIQDKPCPGKLIHWDDLGGHGKVDDMTPAPITDEAPKLVTTRPLSIWYDLDGKTPVSTGHPALTAPRVSPFAAGSKRAIYVNTGTDPVTRRLVLIVPATVTPLPLPVVSCDDVVNTELAKAADRAAIAVRTR